MSFEPIKKITSRTIVLSQKNIDTDQIIPARFLTTTERNGLGKAAFYDWRYDDAGNPRNDSELNLAGQGTHEVLVAGSNFGCGSSREHAPWALLDFGIRVVISSHIADIFKSNSLKNGLLPVEVDTRLHQQLLATPGAQVTVDLETCSVEFNGETAGSFPVEPFARQCLLSGVDPLGHLVNNMPAIEEFERARA